LIEGRNRVGPVCLRRNALGRDTLDAISNLRAGIAGDSAFNDALVVVDKESGWDEPLFLIELNGCGDCIRSATPAFAGSPL
jgi:hypothetical protein